MIGYDNHFQRLSWSILDVVFMRPRVSDTYHDTLEHMHIALLLILF